jgi:hypothetical protein
MRRNSNDRWTEEEDKRLLELRTKAKLFDRRGASLISHLCRRFANQLKRMEAAVENRLHVLKHRAPAT